MCMYRLNIQFTLEKVNSGYPSCAHENGRIGKLRQSQNKSHSGAAMTMSSGTQGVLQRGLTQFFSHLPTLDNLQAVTKKLFFNLKIIGSVLLCLNTIGHQN